LQSVLVHSADCVKTYTMAHGRVLPLLLNIKVILCVRSPVLIYCSGKGLLPASWCWGFLCMAASSN
jgi:hypothetical protein